MSEFDRPGRVDIVQIEPQEGLTPWQKVIIVATMGGGLVIPTLACVGIGGEENNPDSPQHKIEAKKTERAYYKERGSDGALTGKQIRRAEKEAQATADARMYGSK